MKKLTLFLMASLLILSLASCGKKNGSGIHDSKTLYLAWKNFNEKKDADSCRSFIAELEKFEPESFDAYPELHAQTNEQIEICHDASEKILSMIESGESDDLLIYDEGRKINLSMLSYLYNQNYVLEENHQKIFDYFVWLLAAIIITSVILIFLNAREVKKRDKIIYNSEQFLRHSIEVQEAERKRISQELHDTVAQSMRYVSLLAENLSDKAAAEKIISTQNQNIEDIRKLCYNLTPPAISADDMIGALELLAGKIFNGTGDNFDLRIVAEDTVDFSVWSDVQLMSIYRIIQEAFQSIQKHAHASEVTVLFRKDTDGKLKIIISDDGVGMSEEMVEQINGGIFSNIKDLHFGIRNIVERVQLLGGSVVYRSEADCGTQIKVVL